MTNDQITMTNLGAVHTRMHWSLVIGAWSLVIPTDVETLHDVGASKRLAQSTALSLVIGADWATLEGGLGCAGNNKIAKSHNSKKKSATGGTEC